MRKFFVWPVVIAILGYGGTKLYLHHQVGKAVDGMVAMMAPVAKVQYDGISSTLSGELTIDNVRVKPLGYYDQLTIDHIGIDTPSFRSLLTLTDLPMAPSLYGSEIPSVDVGIIVEGIRIPARADYYEEFHTVTMESMAVDDAEDDAAQCVAKYSLSPETLAGLGYKALDFSARVGLKSEPGHDDYMNMSLKFEDMGEFEMGISLDGSFITGLSEDPEYRPSLKKLHMKTIDLSFNERVRNYCSELGLSAEETLMAQMDSFSYVGQTLGIEFDQATMDSYQEYLAGKSSFVITAEPSYPVALSQIDLYRPSDVPALLNLAAVAH